MLECVNKQKQVVFLEGVHIEMYIFRLYFNFKHINNYSVWVQLFQILPMSSDSMFLPTIFRKITKVVTDES